MNTCFSLPSDEYILCVVVGFIILYNNQRDRHYLTRSAIVTPQFSAWRRLLNCADDQSFTNITGLNRKSFYQIVNIIYNEDKNLYGRPKLLENVDRVGLGLLYLGSKMGLKHLSMIFGVVPSTISNILKEVLQRFATHLKSDEAAAVRFPDSSKMQYLASIVQEREPAAANIIGFADGLCLYVECADDEMSQSIYYSGHHKATMINNVLAFSSEGKIIHATVNCPGSWHDSQVASHLMAIVEKKIGEYAICVDQGFSKTDYMEGKFVGAISNRMLKKLQKCSSEVREAETKRHASYISLRQAAEWGMRALQGTFGRLKTRLTGNMQMRRLILTSIVLLHNFRTHNLGLNQIAQVFNPEYEQYLSLETYDRIARYFKN